MTKPRYTKSLVCRSKLSELCMHVSTEIDFKIHLNWHFSASYIYFWPNSSGKNFERCLFADITFLTYNYLTWNCMNKQNICQISSKIEFELCGGYVHILIWQILAIKIWNTHHNHNSWIRKKYFQMRSFFVFTLL